MRKMKRKKERQGIFLTTQSLSPRALVFQDRFPGSPGTSARSQDVIALAPKLQAVAVP